MTADPSLFVFGHNADPEHLAQQARHDLAGLFHGWRVDPPSPRPDEPVVLTFSSAVATAIDEVTVEYWFEYATFGFEDGQRFEVMAELPELQWDTLAWSYVRTWRATIPGHPDRSGVRYTARGRAVDGIVWADTEPGADPTVFGYDVSNQAPPDWIRDAIIYQIFVDRFYGDRPDWGQPPADLDAVYGGTLTGVIEKLDYLQELGVNCLWLTPVFASESAHGYDAIDFEVVEERLGGEAALRTLVADAHGRGMRILLDFAPNHTSRHNPKFLDAQARLDSPYHDWFQWSEWPRRYASFFDVPDMPHMNADNPDVVQYFDGVARRYLHEIGVDGFRLDYVLGPPLLFWTRFARAVRFDAGSAGAEKFTVGEATAGPSELIKFAGRLDGCLDFPTLQAFRQFFVHESLDAAGFDAFLTAHDAYLADWLVLPTFLDNHDMNRFLWSAGGDVRRLRLAALMQPTLPRPPIIYYGTEVGLSQQTDVGGFGFAASRLPMPWGAFPRDDLYAYFQALIHIRRDRASLRRGTRRRLSAIGGLYVFSMSTPDETTLVALNRSSETVVVRNDALQGRDLLGGGRLDGWLQLEPYTGTMIDTEADGRP